MTLPKTKIFATAIALLFLHINSYAQPISIPETMYFAGMKLHLSKGARNIIEKDYISITKNSRYFTSLIQRADLYFPIIEQIFKEENAPPDFKFLALQESSLQSDVVSKSNAVGYWQFKKESAQEVGLQVDSDIDERKNVVASSHGAAKYLKKGNAVLNNWVYTLLAYYLGRGGVMPYVKDKYRNSNEMNIDEDMNWYVLRFLAHKYAYESKVGLVPHPQLRLGLYTNGNGKTLKSIAEEKDIDLLELENYNKWLNVHKIPEGRTYSVILPFKIDQNISGENVVIADNTSTPQSQPVAVVNKNKKQNKSNSKDTKETLGFDPLDLPLIVSHNKLKAVQARPKDSFAKLAYAGDMSVNEFLSHNELESFDKIIVGQLYYLVPKRSKALVMYHTVKAGETIWTIAQMYGIRVASIRKKNRMKMKENIYVGQVLSLRKKISKAEKDKPQNNTPLFMKNQEIEVAKSEPATTTPIPNITASEEGDTSDDTPYNTNKPAPPRQTASSTGNSSNAIVRDMRGELREPVNTVAEQPIESATPVSKPTSTQPIEPKPVVTPSQKSTAGSEATTSTPTNVASVPSSKPTAPSTTTTPKSSSSSTANTPAEPVASAATETKSTTTLPSSKPSAPPQTSTPKTVTTPIPATKDVIKNIGLKDSLQLHTVISGQTLYSISKSYNASIDSLKTWNNLQTNEISIGQALIVKKITISNPPNSDNSIIHTVKMGDTVYKLARENGVSVEDILLWNNKTTMILSIGEKVLIKK